MNELLERRVRTIFRQIREQFPGAMNLHLSLSLPEETFDELADTYVENLMGESGYLNFEAGTYPSSLSVTIRREGSVKATNLDEYIRYMRRKLIQRVLDDALMAWEEKVSGRTERQMQVRKLEEKLIPDQDVVLSLREEGYPDVDPLEEGMFKNGDRIAQEVADLVWQTVQG